MTPWLRLDSVAVRYGGQEVVRDLSLGLEAGEIGCLLGASGVGKTTLLRVIAGFEPVAAGSVWIDGRRVSAPGRAAPAESRGVGMVFQDCALFPHLDAGANIAFGLSRQAQRQRAQRVARLAEMLGLEGLLAKFPHELSGGQQRRVALARALAPGPRGLLLDEPFAGLDVPLRERLARELRQWLKREEITALIVSHSRQDAFPMVDRMGVLWKGALLQWDTPFQVYHRPNHVYVANFVGEGSLIAGSAVPPAAVDTFLGRIGGAEPHGLPAGRQVQVLIRPDDIIHDDDSALTAKVADKLYRGAEFLYILTSREGERICTLVPSHHDHAIGESIGIRLEIDHLVVFPAHEGESPPDAGGAGGPKRPDADSGSLHGEGRGTESSRIGGDSSIPRKSAG
ncbi:MAG: ABC transporter ATP-binding protein [Gammaproteobacteria bacterium]|nr:ABC transporter ATP-binding protein [Gammaproteobacteria bacterium]